MQGTPVGNLSENVELGTPSAPPFMDVGNAHDSEAGSEKSIGSKHNELEQGFLGDRGFAEQSNKSVKFETEVGQRYDEKMAFYCIGLVVLHVSFLNSHYL